MLWPFPSDKVEGIQGDYSESFHCVPLRFEEFIPEMCQSWSLCLYLPNLGDLVKKLHWKRAVLSLMVQQRHMFSEDPVIMQKGAGLGLLKRDPMKEELLDSKGISMGR